MYIYLSKGNRVAVDDDAVIPQVPWREVGGYAATTLNKKTVYMHRLITGAKRGQYVDHIDGDRLNNHLANLRLCTARQNNFNRGIGTNNTSGFKGIFWLKRRKKWLARLEYGKKQYWGGEYKTPEEAALAYNRLALTLHGEFAKLNTVNNQD